MLKCARASVERNGLAISWNCSIPVRLTLTFLAVFDDVGDKGPEGVVLGPQMLEKVVENGSVLL